LSTGHYQRTGEIFAASWQLPLGDYDHATTIWSFQAFWLTSMLPACSRFICRLEHFRYNPMHLNFIGMLIQRMHICKLSVIFGIDRYLAVTPTPE